MNKEKIISILKKYISESQIKQDELMKRHTSFKIGGPAEIFITIKNINELQKIIQDEELKKVPKTIIGNGSNILVTEKGIKGIVIKLDFKEIKIEAINKQDFKVTLGSGVLMGFIAQKLLKEGITGFEELSGIPGTIGGCTVMNAGAHGKEIKDIVTEVTAIDFEGNKHIFLNKDLQFSYRKSIFEKQNYIITEVKLLLQKGNKNKIKSKMQEFMQYRKDKQPIEYPNAGSTFKRGEDFVTAKLIDEAGLKGYRIGDAQISEKHAGFIVNMGNATAKDVLDLIEYTTDKIYEKYNKRIQLEIKVIGE